MRLLFKLVAVLLTATALTASLFLISSSIGDTKILPVPTPTKKPNPTPQITPSPTPPTTFSPSPSPSLYPSPSTVPSPSLSPSPSASLLISKPPIPEFGLEFFGQTFYPSQQNNVIEIQILNQRIQNFGVNNAKVYSNVRFKTHLGNEWTELYHYDSSSSGSLPLQQNVFDPIGIPTFTVLNFPASNYSQGAQLDFQAKALIGAYITSGDATVFNVLSESDWSNTKTVTIPTPAIEYGETSAASASFGSFFGYFNITAPSNATYNSDVLSLNVTGSAAVASNVRLIMTYSIDGQEPLPLPVMRWQQTPTPPAAAINGSIILPQLTNGSHTITVYGDLELNGTHLAQATVYFAVSSTKDL